MSSIGDTFQGLPMGAKIVVTILGLVLGGYALALISIIVIGVIANVGLGGGVTLPQDSIDTINTTYQGFNAIVNTILSPYTTIAALVIIAVLLAIFFRGKMPGSDSGKGVN